MVAYPYTGSGYGGAGVPYANDPVGQSFRVTTTSDIVATASSLPIFKTLVSLLVETGLDYELLKAGPFTVFAPTDDAFASLLDPHGFATLGPLLRPENRDALRDLLLYHVVPGEVTADDICNAGSVTTETMLPGAEMTLMGYNKTVNAAEGSIIRADVLCSNGVIHIINKVLTPVGFVTPPTSPVPKTYPDSIISDVYGKTLTPRQALGIDPAPVAGALASSG